MKKIVIFLAFFLMSLPSVMATQPTQNYNQIFLNPFVLPTMSNNNNYSFIVNVNPSDGINSVKSAIISFDVYMTPSVNFTLWINGSLCNTQFFYVSTTFAGSGQGRIKFDCSNRITKAGTYNVTLRPSGANTGSINGWLDMTYMNNPKMENLFVSGTEYQTGEAGTIFLQLKDSQGTPINNGNCYLDVYYPSSGNLSHPQLYHDIGMLYKNGSNGIYYFDMIVPNVTGIYMLGASCAYSYDINWLYPPTENLKNLTRTVTQGTYTGDTLILNSYEDGLYTSCTTVSKICDAYYDFNTTGIDNITNLDIYYIGEADKITTLTMSVWNWTSNAWVTLPNTLTFAGTGQPSFPVGMGESITNILAINNHTINYTTKIIRIRLYTTGANTVTQWDNWLSIKYLTQEGQIQELKGSGELHVSNALSNLTVKINTTDLNSILSAIASVNQTLNTTILNFLVTINGTTFNINGTQYNSLLTAINSVNATSNQSLSLLISINGSVFNLSISELNHFNQLLALLNQINSSLNTTIVNYLSYINGTTFQMNQSQTAYYLSLLGSLEALNTTLNGSITQYLVAINGTTYNLSVNEFNHYVSLLQAINSVNQTLNTTILNYLIGINGTSYNTNQQIPLILQYLHDINMTTNTTIPASLISINNTQNSHYASIMSFLASINYTGNTTLELKLDQINTTVVQINQTVNQINTSLNNLNVSVNLTQLLDAIGQVNTTVSQNQQYLMVINGTVFQINSSIIQIFNDLASINSTQNANYLSLYNFLQQINATGNTTLTFVASINQSLLSYYLDLRSFLESINVSINTTMENKLDQINTTVNQINASLSALNVTVNLTGLYDALASINETINSTILNAIITTNSNVLNHNSSEYQHFLAMSVLLNDLNYGINTTLENKLDFINSTTWQTLLLLQNLTIGNVSVSAVVNWTEGYKNLTFLSFSDKIGGDGITLTSETLTCISNTTLQHIINATQCSQGMCWQGNSTITEICEFGCKMNQCVPVPQLQYMTAIGIAMIIFGGIYVAYRAWK